MAPPFEVLSEDEFNARYGTAGAATSSMPAPQVTPPAAPLNPATMEVIDEAEYTRRYGSMGQNALQAIKDLPSGLVSAPEALYDTGKGTVSAALSGIDTQEERQAVRNLGSMAAATSGGLAGAGIGSFLGPVGTVAGGAIGGGLGLLGIDWFAENQGVDAPRTGKERLNDLAYNVTGGVTGDVALRGLGVAAKGISNPIKRTFTEAGQTEAAANVARKIYPDDAILRLDEADSALMKQPLSEYKTTADVLGTEGAAQLQKQLQMESFGDPIGQKLQAREVARKELLQGLAPESASITGVQREIADQMDNLRYTAGAADKVLGPSIDPTSAGSGLREIAEMLYGKRREMVQSDFRGIPESEARRFTPSSDLLSATDRLQELFGPGSEGAPSELKRMVETLNPQLKQSGPPVDATTRMLQEIQGTAPKEVDPRVSLDYLQRLRRWGGEAATKAFNKGENRAGSVAQAVVKDIDEGLEQAVKDGTMPAAQANAYKKALNAHKEMAQTFERGPMGRILRRGEGVEGYNIEPSSVGRQFWNSNPESMKSFTKALGGNMEAREYLVRDAVTDFRTSTRDVDGGFKPKDVKRWMGDHEAFLNTFPEAKQAVNEIYVSEAKRALKQKNFGKFVEANPEQAASVLLEGRESVRVAENLLKDIKGKPELLEGVRRGIIDKLHDNLYNIAELEAKPAAFKRFMDKNGSVLQKYFEPEQMQALEAIYSDLKSEVRTEDLARSASRGNSVTAQKGALKAELSELVQNEFGTVGSILRNGGKVGSALGAATGYAKGGVLGGIVGGSVGGSLGAKVTNIIKRAEDAAMRELAKAAADRNFARDLLMKSSSARKNAIRQVLEKKVNPLRQIIVSGYLGAREDDNKAAEDLASLLPENRLTATPTATPTPTFTSAADLAEALLQPASLRTMPRGQDMNTTKPKAPQAGAPVGDVDLTPRRIDSALVDAVVMQESAGKANAIGPRTKYGNAKGLMQLLDSTGKEWHKKLGLKGEYDPFNAEQNKAIGTAYLDSLTSRYEGSVPLGLAAYNWGMGNLEKAFDKLGAKGPIPVQAMMEEAVIDGMSSGLSEKQAKRAAAAKVVDTFGIEVLNPYMPAETRNYVRKIMSNYNKKRGSGLVEV